MFHGVFNQLIYNWLDNIPETLNVKKKDGYKKTVQQKYSQKKCKERLDTFISSIILLKSKFSIFLMNHHNNIYLPSP